MSEYYRHKLERSTDMSRLITATEVKCFFPNVLYVRRRGCKMSDTEMSSQIVYQLSAIYLNTYTSSSNPRIIQCLTAACTVLDTTLLPILFNRMATLHPTMGIRM